MATINEVMTQIAELQHEVEVKQAEIAEIAKKISKLEGEGLGIKPGKNLGIIEMIKLIQRIMSEAIVTTTEKDIIN